MKSRFILLALLALLAAGQTAMAETVTYTISGNIELTQSNLTVTASGSASGTVTDSWDITKTSECSVTLPGSISLSFGSDKTTSLGVESGTLRIQASGSTGGYITLSHASKYIYHVTLKDNSGGVIHEAWNMEKSYTHRFQAIYVKTIVVEYADKIPITDAVISGVDNSYIVSDTPVQPAPTVTWHATTLTKNTDYTLSYQNSSAAGTATVKATGTGIFSAETSVSQNYTLVWATYTVRFNKNSDDASGTMSNQAFTYSTAQALTANAFTAPTGYAFAGWSTTPDGAVAYTNGQSVTNLTATNGATVDLYAQWTLITYTVRFNANGGSGTMSDQAFTYNSAQNLTANTFTAPTGYLFAGWATNADGTGNTYTDSQSVSNLTAINGATVDLYAQWTPISWEGDGSGTADNPYQISNYAELKQFANIVNGTGSEAYAKLVADIVCKNSFDDVEYATDWVPIGNASHPYTGAFDGQGYTITGLSTPTSNSSNYVGLFGYMGSQGVVQDVILEDATITGNNHVGVIAGYNNNGTLTSNYYVSCSVNSAATNIGTGSGDCKGARSVHALSLPANVTASGESVVINSAAHYAASTTVTLSYSGTVPDGYSVSYSYNDGSDHAIKGDTFTMPAANVTVSAQYISNVRYIDGNGIEQVCSNYTIIQSSNSLQRLGDNSNNSNKEAWYVVAGDVTVEGGIVFYDRPALILCDGATLTVIADDVNGITSYFDFTIYAQSGGTGSLSATGPIYGIRGEKSVAITGGNVSATGGAGISSGEAITITGGNVSATGNTGIYGKTVTISGGNVSATGDQNEGIKSYTGINLGWTNTSDSIYASSYTNHITVDRSLTIDGTDTYSGTLTRQEINAIAGKTLRPYLSPTGGTPITLVQGTKDGVTAWWGTFCNSTYNFVLSEGAAAYTLGSDYKLYRLGSDGRTIPKNTAVVIIASEAKIRTYDIGNRNLLVTDHAPGGNQLQGSNSAVDVSGLSGAPYVLSVDGNGVIGFREYTGTEIPANKAYYVE